MKQVEERGKCYFPTYGPHLQWNEQALIEFSEMLSIYQ